MTQVKLKIDIANGTVEIEADGESFALAMDRAEAILDKFSKIEFRPLNSKPAEDRGADTDGPDHVEVSAEESATKPKKRKSASSAKVSAWKIVDNLLSEDKRKILRDFFEEKKPGGQNEKVAVLAH